MKMREKWRARNAAATASFLGTGILLKRFGKTVT